MKPNAMPSVMLTVGGVSIAIAARTQNGRLNEDDVGHGQERRDAGQNFGADSRPVLGQVEDALEHAREASAPRTRERASTAGFQPLRLRVDRFVFVSQSTGERWTFRAR